MPRLSPDTTQRLVEALKKGAAVLTKHAEQVSKPVGKTVDLRELRRLATRG